MIRFTDPNESSSKSFQNTECKDPHIKHSFQGRLNTIVLNISMAEIVLKFQKTEFYPKCYGNYYMPEFEDQCKTFETDDSEPEESIQEKINKVAILKKKFGIKKCPKSVMGAISFQRLHIESRRIMKQFDCKKVLKDENELLHLLHAYLE